jgi:hypothetical protein
VHPLAGQGLNLGIADAEALALALAEAVEVGADVGGGGVLSRFNEAQYARNTALLAGIDLIRRLFSSSLAGVPLVHWPALRSLGLHALNLAPGVKAALAGVAVGDPLPAFNAWKGLSGVAAGAGGGPDLPGAAAQVAAHVGEAVRAGQTVATNVAERIAAAIKQGPPGPWGGGGAAGSQRW